MRRYMIMIRRKERKNNTEEGEESLNANGEND